MSKALQSKNQTGPRSQKDVGSGGELELELVCLFGRLSKEDDARRLLNTRDPQIVTWSHRSYGKRHTVRESSEGRSVPLHVKRQVI